MTGVETLSFDDGDIGVSSDSNGLVLTGDATGDDITIVGSVPVTVLGADGDDDIVGGRVTTSSMVTLVRIQCGRCW